MLDVHPNDNAADNTYARRDEGKEWFKVIAPLYASYVDGLGDRVQISDLLTPAALIERSTMENNTTAMSDRAHRLGVRLRPHVKTHKCVDIARLQVEDHFGGITVSTLAEAKFFAAADFRDITLAVPVSLGRLPELFDFAQQVDAFHLLVDS